VARVRQSFPPIGGGGSGGRGISNLEYHTTSCLVLHLKKYEFMFRAEKNRVQYSIVQYRDINIRIIEPLHVPYSTAPCLDSMLCRAPHVMPCQITTFHATLC